jgi:hypothetical protein
MRIHELADELNVASQDIIDVLNDDLGINKDHHMCGLEPETARRVKIALQEASLDDTPVFPESKAKKLFGKAMDTIAFGVGLGLLLSPNRGDDTRKNIREEVRDLGREITDPFKIAGEEIIDLLEIFPTQVGHLTRNAVDFNTDKLKQFGPVVQGAFDMVNSQEITNFLSNGKGHKETSTKR